MSEEINIETLEMSIDDLKLSGNNPRTISKKDFDILKRSIKDFPSMLEVREVVKAVYKLGKDLGIETGGYSGGALWHHQVAWAKIAPKIILEDK